MRGTPTNTALSSYHVTKDPVTGKLITVCLETGEIVSEVPSYHLEIYRFNEYTAKLICNRIREGEPLSKITSDPDFPDINVVSYWQKQRPEFAMELRLARQERAERYHDKVLEIAESDLFTKDDVAIAKFRADQYRWAAEKGDPSRYGNKTEVSGTIENKVSMIVLNTGITRTKPDVVVDFKEKTDDATIESKVEEVKIEDGKDDPPPF